MYQHQMKVLENEKCLLWFLWGNDNDSSKVAFDHEMTAHVFGGLLSTCCSNYALKKTAADNVKKYEEKV